MLRNDSPVPHRRPTREGSPMTSHGEADPGNSYDQIHERLQRAVSAVCPPWLSDRRDDLVQIALIRVMEVERRSEGKREFASSYLWRVAYSALIDEIRRLRRRQEVSIEEGEGGPMQIPSPSSWTPDRRVAAHELGEAIRNCLSSMVPSRRQAVTLHLQGHTVPEVAKIQGWTVKKAENLVYRGKDDLRRCLTAKGLEP